ncbi:MAG TPA: aminotransferase class V-fold PLP-dependent enzyme [Bryobacteraceae bacterium]|jgi:L-seryl-tRNA(Ser) seleniumtransferase|nr:aminotransferase class V-fold PLP-dependent enzyme [Bryobacteraceae bacterium]
MKTTRRSLLQSAAATPLFARPEKPRHNPGKGVYDELGIRPVINFRGTHTVIGASKVWPEIHQAMTEASRHYVDLEELQDKVGARLAALIGTPAAMVTTGTAGAMAVGTCACLTGPDAKKVRQLPDLEGMKTEAVIQKVHRNVYDHAVRMSGVKIVEVETREQLQNALSERTALMYYLGGSSGDWAYETPVQLPDCLEIAHKAGVPVMVDAANMLPPWENIRKLAALGTDLICVSGGKHMRGPQCSGILAGRQDLVAAARLNMNPHSDAQGRPMKVGREEIIGLWLSAEKYARLDFEAIDRECQAQAEYLQRELAKIPGLRLSFAPHDRTRKVHRLVVDWDEKAMGLTGRECEQKLLEGEPRIAVLRDKGHQLVFTVFMNDPGDEKLAARRMKEIFASTRRA